VSGTSKRREILQHLADTHVGRAVVYHGLRWGWVVAVGVLGVAAFPGSSPDQLPTFALDEIPRRDVIAPFDFPVLKTEAELAAEAEARAASVRPIFEYRPQAYDSALTRVERVFRVLDDAAPGGPDSLEAAAALLGITLTRSEASYVRSLGRRNGLQAAVGRHLGATLHSGVAGAGLLSSEPAREVVLRRDRTERIVPRDSLLSYEAYLARAALTNPDPRSLVAGGLYGKILQAVFRPTIVYNRAETEERRAELRHSVSSVKRMVREGERIVPAQEPVTRETLERLEALRAEWESRSGRGMIAAVARRGIGPWLRFALPLAVFWALLQLYRRETYSDLRQMTLFGLLFAAVVSGGAVVARYVPGHPELVALPLLAMLVTALFNGRLSTIASMVGAVAVGTQPVFRSTSALFLMLIPAVAAALSMRIVRRRSQVYFSVLVVAATFVVVALAVGLTERWSLAEIGQSALWGAVNVVISSALVMMVLPLAEWGTGITTDLSLLELSDPSHPLLRRLATEAPGTYAHSIAMANLCEPASTAIGANGLLARVGCYFHDVGKLANPQYFVENQSRGVNPHDRMKPQKSAQIIRDHVEQGLTLAAKHRLPAVVRAFIPEHHGTMPITYFLVRAQERATGEAINPADYRYPGPLPRSAETAVAMLADAVEAAVRVLDDPTPERVRDAVAHIVRQRIEQGQLREAPLTLADLDRVQSEFVGVLTGVHHNRIDYPAASGGITARWSSRAS